MARPPRIIIEGGIYHVFSRGVKQCNMFLENADRYDFLRLLKIAQEEYPFTLHNRSLMDNHYHLLIQPQANTLSKIMHLVNSTYGNRFNKRHQITGHVLQGRFHSIPVETDAYLTTVSRYIDLNAVRAGIVTRPEDYPWSSYRSTILGIPDTLGDPSFVLGYFGKDVDRQREAYRRFVEDAIQKPEAITEKVLWRMRAWGNPWRRLSAGDQMNEEASRPAPNGALILR